MLDAPIESPLGFRLSPTAYRYFNNISVWITHTVKLVWRM